MAIVKRFVGPKCCAVAVVVVTPLDNAFRAPAFWAIDSVLVVLFTFVSGNSTILKIRIGFSNIPQHWHWHWHARTTDALLHVIYLNVFNATICCNGFINFIFFYIFDFFCFVLYLCMYVYTKPLQPKNVCYKNFTRMSRALNRCLRHNGCWTIERFQFVSAPFYNWLELSRSRLNNDDDDAADDEDDIDTSAQFSGE